MTTNALSAKSGVIARGCPGVARVARYRGVRPQQREPVPVILCRSRVDPPSVHRVAVLALRAELPLVEIRMTIGALLPGLCKNFRHMARITRHIRVHAAQRIVCVGVVIKFRPRTERRPTRRRVAVLTRNS